MVYVGPEGHHGHPSRDPRPLARGDRDYAAKATRISGLAKDITEYLATPDDRDKTRIALTVLVQGRSYETRIESAAA